MLIVKELETHGDYQILVDFPTRKEAPSRNLLRGRVRVGVHRGASADPHAQRFDSSVVRPPVGQERTSGLAARSGAIA